MADQIPTYPDAVAEGEGTIASTLLKSTLLDEICAIRGGRAPLEDIWATVLGGQVSAEQLRVLSYYLHLTRGWPIDGLVDFVIGNSGNIKALISRPRWHLPLSSTAPEELRNLIARLKPVDPGRTLCRLGGPHDGGYLVPDDFEGMGHSFSPGVGPSIDFDLDVARRGLQVHFADGSVPGLPASHPNYTF